MVNALVTIEDLDLVRIIPESISDDADVGATAYAIGEQLKAFVNDVQASLPLMPNLDRLPERIVDLLAWDYHVDYYDPDAPIAAKRERVRRAIQDHRIQGTKAAVQYILDVVFGEGNNVITEWFQNGGDPYTFEIETEGAFVEGVMTKLAEALMCFKNVRSWYVLKAKRVSELQMCTGFAMNTMVSKSFTVTN
jgi:phage tail P2-like protein